MTRGPHDPQKDAAHPQESGNVPPNRGGLSGRTVLIVDDIELVRYLAERVLRRRGVQALLAADGVEALALVEQHVGAIDLVVTDVQMPRMSGIELARTLRVRHPQLPILFMTGFAEEALLAGDDVHIVPKPFGPADLEEAVRAALGSAVR